MDRTRLYQLTFCFNSKLKIKYLEGVLQSSSVAKSFLLNEEVLITSDSLNELLLEGGLEHGVSFSLYKNSLPKKYE